MTANFAGSADYTAVSSSTVGFTITPAPLTITAIGSTKVYDSTTNVTDGARPTVSGLLGTDTVTGLTESFTSPNAGNDPTLVNPGYCIHDGDGGGNYCVTTNPGSGTIGQALVVGSWALANKIYDGTNTATVTGTSLIGVVAGDNVSISVTSAFFAYPSAGTWAVMQSQYFLTGSDSSNYMLEPVAPATATITPATAKIVVAPYNVTFNGNSHTATGTVMGINSALPSSDLNLNGTIHTNAGTYRDTWTFTVAVHTPKADVH